jgi:hemerythrin
MNKLQWQDKYKVGNEVVDSQHQQLFELAKLTIEASDHAEITRLFMLFYKHVREHFKTEEDFMRNINYEGYQQHLEAHNKMLDHLIEVSEKQHSKQLASAEIQTFVESWVLEHILEEDLKLDHDLKQQKRFK